MIRKWKLLLVGVSCVMGTAMAQNNPILLFPKVHRAKQPS